MNCKDNKTKNQALIDSTAKNVLTKETSYEKSSIN
jgi:hypothetical protein